MSNDTKESKMSTIAELKGGSGLFGRSEPVQAAPTESNTATEAQTRFLSKLIAERGEKAEGIGTVIERAKDKGKFTKRLASEMIDYLKNHVEVVSPAPEGRRANRFAGRCADCGVSVAEGDGWITKGQGGWETRHNACPDVEDVAEVDEGFYSVDGTIYKVQVAVNGSGNLYAKVERDGNFDYSPGGIATIAKGLADGTAAPLSQDEAAEWGRLYGRCVVCSRTLTDEASVAAGIGPVCAKRF